MARTLDVLPPQRAHASKCLAATTADNGNRDGRQHNHDRERKHFAVLYTMSGVGSDAKSS